jgi:hypothetical protein
MSGCERGAEESGEQCTVVFALIVTEPASECVCVWVGGGVVIGANQSGLLCYAEDQGGLLLGVGIAWGIRVHAPLYGPEKS